MNDSETQETLGRVIEALPEPYRSQMRTMRSLRTAWGEDNVDSFLLLLSLRYRDICAEREEAERKLVEREREIELQREIIERGDV